MLASLLGSVGAEQRSQVPSSGEGSDRGDVTRNRLAGTHDLLAASAVGKHKVEGPPCVVEAVETVWSERVESSHPAGLLASPPNRVRCALKCRERKIAEAATAGKVVGDGGRVMIYNVSDMLGDACA